MEIRLLNLDTNCIHFLRIERLTFEVRVSTVLDI